MMRDLYLRDSRVKHPYVLENNIREAAYDKIDEKLVVMLLERLQIIRFQQP